MLFFESGLERSQLLDLPSDRAEPALGMSSLGFQRATVIELLIELAECGGHASRERGLARFKRLPLRRQLLHPLAEHVQQILGLIPLPTQLS